jgi:hypothetical protein
LNTASTTFTIASQDSVAVTRAGAPAAVRIQPVQASTTPSATLTPGPASATRSSTTARDGWVPSSDTPPSSHSVIRRTSSPLRRATIACASSWASRDTTNATAPTLPASPYPMAVAPGASPGNTVDARRALSTPTPTSADQWAPTGTPAILPNENVAFMAPPELLGPPALSTRLRRDVVSGQRAKGRPRVGPSAVHGPFAGVGYGDQW